VQVCLGGVMERNHKNQFLILSIAIEANPLPLMSVAGADDGVAAQ